MSDVKNMDIDGEAASEKEQLYNSWKANIPVLYDVFENHNLDLPAYSCCWGQKVKQHEIATYQRLFLTRATNAEMPKAPAENDPQSASPSKSDQVWPGHPHLLLVAAVKLPHGRRAGASDARMSQFSEMEPSNAIEIEKRIIHPGGINMIKHLTTNPEIVVTHCDSPYVFLWNTKTQPDRPVREGSVPSKPDFILKGHMSKAMYALDCGKDGAVASGGSDNRVCLWKIEDSETTLATEDDREGQEKKKDDSAPPVLNARTVLTGHTETVEDVSFSPQNENILCSGGDDRSLIIWDARDAKPDKIVMKDLHGHDINALSWCPSDEYLIATGSSDNLVKVVDTRKTSEAVRTFRGHHDHITGVQWHPESSQYLASSAEDGLLNIWDLKQNNKEPARYGDQCELFFRHAGHRTSLASFDWLSGGPDSWTLATLSDDSGHSAMGGGTLQIWRVTDLLTRPEDEVVREIEQLECVQRFVF
eukprot:136958_1